MFTDINEARYSKGKSTLNKKLRVEVSTRTHVIILDCCAVLYRIHWPKDVSVKDLVDALVDVNMLKKHLQVAGITTLRGRQG